MHDFDRKLQLKLHVWQSVVEIEQRRVYLRFARGALDDEREVDFPSTWRRRLRVVGHKRRTGVQGTDRRQQTNPKKEPAEFHTTSRRTSFIRLVFQIFGGNDLRNATLTHADDASSDLDGLGAVMGNIEQGETELRVKAEQFAA